MTPEKRAVYTCPTCGTIAAEDVTVDDVGERRCDECGDPVTNHRFA